MKKVRPHFLRSRRQRSAELRNSDLKLQTEQIYQDLEIRQRTQVPPSEELIAKLNRIASQPPFSYIHKKKDYDPL